MNDNLSKNADIDGVLSAYFKAQMPAVWPAWKAPTARKSVPRNLGRWLTFKQLAVAASVGALLAAYLALAGFFPREAAGKMNHDPSRHIGLKSTPK